MPVFGKFSGLAFLITSVFRFTLLPYYQNLNVKLKYSIIYRDMKEIMPYTQE